MNLVEKIERTRGVEIPLLFFRHVVAFCLSFPVSVARITRSTTNSELSLSTHLHILTDQFFVACRIWNRWSFVWRRRLTVFYVVLLFGAWWIPVQPFARLAELRIAHEEQHVQKFELQVTDYTCTSFVGGRHRTSWKSQLCKSS